MFDAFTRLPEFSTGWQAEGMPSATTSSSPTPRGPLDGNRTVHQPRFGFGLTQADVDELRELIHRECGESLSPEDAWKRAAELLALFRMLLGPLPEDSGAAGFPQAPVLTESKTRGITE